MTGPVLTQADFNIAAPVIAIGQDSLGGSHVISTDASGNVNMNVVNGMTIDVDLGNVGGLAANDTTPSGNPLWVAGWDGTNVQALATDTIGHLQVDVLANALPTGASTAALQTTGNTALSTINTTLGTPMQATGGKVQEVPGTSGGNTLFELISGASTNASSIKGSAGQVYGIHASNATANMEFVKLYNKATAPTVGSDTPLMTFGIPGGSNSLDGSSRDIVFPLGVPFSTGIALATTANYANADTVAVGAGDLIINLLYT